MGRGGQTLKTTRIRFCGKNCHPSCSNYCVTPLYLIVDSTLIKFLAHRNISLARSVAALLYRAVFVRLFAKYIYQATLCPDPFWFLRFNGFQYLVVPGQIRELVLKNIVIRPLKILESKSLAVTSQGPGAATAVAIEEIRSSGFSGIFCGINGSIGWRGRSCISGNTIMYRGSRW
jgi:hypothetical protein